MKVLLQNKSGKQVEFETKTAEYMMKNGWKKAVQPKKAKTDTKPPEADK